jgi:dTMP kinase
MPLFISFEGPDGSGKSTQARLLAQALRRQGHTVTETREPGGTPLGEQVRAVLLDPDGPGTSPLAMAFLLSAARAQLVGDVISPALRRGEVVIADRFADSTIAYQSFGLGLDRQVVRQLAEIATGGVYPGTVVYVDVPARIGLQRVAARGERNRLDAASLTFHERVRAGYHQLIREEPERWIVVDGDAPAETVHQRILEALRSTLNEVDGAA